MKTTVTILLVAVMCMMFGGCATITRGVTQPIYISSTPSGAEVYIDGCYYGRTPLTVSMARAREHTVVIGGSIYEPETVFIRRQFSGAIAGNILIGGIIGVGVDALSGASYDLIPSSVYVPLRRKRFGY